MFRSRFIPLLVLTFWACSTSGVMNGWLSDHSESAGRVVFTFMQTPSADRGDISITLRDGEYYHGPFLQITASTPESAATPLFPPWDPYWSSWQPFSTHRYDITNFPSFRADYTGLVIASLQGTRGGAMRCRFQLRDPQNGLNGGGTGQCQISTGGTIDVQF